MFLLLLLLLQIRVAHGHTSGRQEIALSINDRLFGARQLDGTTLFARSCSPSQETEFYTILPIDATVKLNIEAKIVQGTGVPSFTLISALVAPSLTGVAPWQPGVTDFATRLDGWFASNVGRYFCGPYTALGGRGFVGVGDSISKTYTQLPAHRTAALRLLFVNFGAWVCFYGRCAWEVKSTT
jgi:hypothetical protein